jgi:hypothetical protein
MFILLFMFMFMFMFVGEPVARAPIFMRCSCRARAFCIISDGKIFALGVGLLAVFSNPVTLELGLIVLAFCGAETVLREGIRRGGSLGGRKPGIASESALGGSRGVLASESSSEPGEAGLLGAYSSAGVTGSELS